MKRNNSSKDKHLNADYVTPEVILYIITHDIKHTESNAKGTPQWCMHKRYWIEAGVPESAFKSVGLNNYKASVAKRKIRLANKLNEKSLEQMLEAVDNIGVV